MTAEIIRRSLDKAIENMAKRAVSDYFKRRKLVQSINSQLPQGFDRKGLK